MTTWLSGAEIGRRIEQGIPGAVEETGETAAWVLPGCWHEVAKYLKETPGLDFDYLSSITAVDYIDHFEMVYHLTSIQHNHACVIKARCWGREEPSIPSVTDLWRGAEQQEREVYDLMGITFPGHPLLKRILLWEGFPGHPLRKDYLEAPLPYTWPHGG